MPVLKMPVVTMPALEMATSRGVVHRLTWVNRSQGNYELKCRCGWVGPDRTSSWGMFAASNELQTRAVGNAHVRDAAKG